MDDLIKDKKKVAAPKAKSKAAAGKGGAKGGKGAKGSKGGKEKGGTAKNIYIFGRDELARMVHLALNIRLDTDFRT